MQSGAERSGGGVRGPDKGMGGGAGGDPWAGEDGGSGARVSQAPEQSSQCQEEIGLKCSPRALRHKASNSRCQGWLETMQGFT